MSSKFQPVVFWILFILSLVFVWKSAADAECRRYGGKPQRNSVWAECEGARR